jgi:hypothetical protein
MPVNDALSSQYLRNRAAEAQRQAQESGDQAESPLMILARIYLELAERAGARERGEKVLD